jgi:hypothetical protein
MSGLIGVIDLMVVDFTEFAFRHPKNRRIRDELGIDALYL